MSLKLFRLWSGPVVACLLSAAARAACTQPLAAAPPPDPTPEQWKFILSIIGYFGAVVAFLVGLRQYRRADYWKRSQFLAQEMRAFFDDPKVENARTMIDWGVRDIPLLSPRKLADGSEDSGQRTVDRKLQCKALRPHDFSDTATTATRAASSSDDAVTNAPSSDAVRMPERPSLGGTGFEPEEAAIRDCYDRFLDGFERLGNYRRGELVSVSDLRPYVEYWIGDIVDTRCDAEDSLWCVFLFAYIEFYAFAGVQALFDSFGHDLRIGSSLVVRFVNQCSDKPRAERLLDHVRKAKVGVALD